MFFLRSGWLGLASLLLPMSVRSTWGTQYTGRVPFAAREGLLVRGGDEGEERYSRQVYTLGARAHGIFRSSTTVILDGPSTSGLVYETAKNLALLGVGNMILVQNGEDEADIVDPLDDMGNAYLRNARAELKMSDEGGYSLLQGYLQRLNPHLHVTIAPRSTVSITTEKAVHLVVDRPIVDMSDTWPLVTVETAGVFGRVQCDFGDDFVVYDADGEPPISVPLDILEHNSDDEDIMVRCVSGEQHDVSVGDAIEFQLRNGTVVAPDGCTVTSVQSPERFRIRLMEDEDVTSFCSTMNEHAAIVRRRKVPLHVSFRRLADLDVKDDALFAPCDFSKSFDGSRRHASMASFGAMAAFVKEHGRKPSREDRERFFQLISEHEIPDEEMRHVDNFLRGCAAKLAPLQAVFGAIAAQETLKAATGLYTPITQVLLYDCDEVLVNEHDVDQIGYGSRASGLRYILGNDITDVVQDTTTFVVGAGAIGCELLKNLAAMGMKRLIVTDMDTIEPSNLSRQLLFRDSDIGKFKSLAAKEATIRLEPNMDIEVHSSKVGPGGDNPFDEDFWSQEVGVVLNALDNVEARLYIDSQCVANYKPLVDAGTMGSKGNVQVVVPRVSESYASSVDPPEPSIAVCTLKNFPYAISHTIQWGRDLFDGLFRRRPRQANEMTEKLESEIDIRVVAHQLVQEKGLELAMETTEELAEDIITTSEQSIPRIRSEALVWAARLAYKLYYKSPVELLKEHPLDSKDEDGEPFWSGSRRPPKLIEFNGSPGTEVERTIDDNLVQFVLYGAHLRAETMLANCENSKFTEAEARTILQAFQKYPSDSAEKSQAKIQKVLSRCAEVSVESPLGEIEFEKDDDVHASFCTAASNLRAIAYGIPPVDMAETRRVAGRIIPAMITTTALVSGLSCIELIKLVQTDEATQFRNAFLNLALNFFAFTAPAPAPDRPGFRGQQYTLWDRWDLQESSIAAARGGVRMKSICRRLKKIAFPENPDLVEIVSISLGPFLLYSNFLHEFDEEVLHSCLWDRLEEAVMADDDDDDDEVDGGEIDITGPYVDLEILVEDAETGEAIELPVVRVRRSTTNK